MQSNTSIKWFFPATDNCTRIKQFLDYNSISYHTIDLWDSAADLNLIPQWLIDKKDTVLCMDINQLALCYAEDKTRNALFEYLNTRSNKILLYQDIDLFTFMHKNINLLYDLDAKIPFPQSIIALCETESESNDPSFLPLKSIYVDTRLKKSPWFLSHGIYPRLPFNAKHPKANCAYDFLCIGTMYEMAGFGQQKQYVAQELVNNKLVFSRSLTSFDQNLNKSFVGSGIWPDVDLTNQCYFDIVPEVCASKGYYFTEKIQRPLLTRTPFLVYAAPGYLEKIREYGFRTFSNAFDESYDNEKDLITRSIMIIEQAESISRIGASKIYNKLLPEINHNFNNLLQLSGNAIHQSDKILFKILDEFDLL